MIFMRQPLETFQIQAALTGLDGWTLDNGKLLKVYVFIDFKAALVFINQLGDVSEKLNHHPEILNLLNKVTLRLSTHDAGNQVTEKDLTLARAIQSLALS